MDESFVIFVCGHKFCNGCATNVREHAPVKCPMCKKKLNAQKDFRTIVRNQERIDRENVHGSKLVQLADLLRSILLDNTEKVVVFAQFERLLQLVGESLKQLNVAKFVHVRGNIHSQQQSLDQFRNDPETRIILLSSDKTISGVTLTEANHVVAVHPPMDTSSASARALLTQAIGRVHRITQQRECHFYALITKDTVEEALFEKSHAFR